MPENFESSQFNNEFAIAGVVLAGGRSSRMQGQNKAFASLGDKTLIEMVVERARPQVQALYINADNKNSRPQTLGLPIVPDTIPNNAGPLAGLLAAMDQVTKNGDPCTHLASFPVDSPFYPKDLVKQLYRALQFNQAQIAIPRYRGQAHWVLGLWSLDLVDDLRHFLLDLNQRKVQDWIKSQPHCFVDFDSLDSDPFFNINTPNELAIANKRIGI